MLTPKQAGQTQLRLNGLQPEVANRVRDLLKELAELPCPLYFMVSLGYRTIAEQDALYDIGRTKKGADTTPARPMGRTVTNARGGDSWHNYGRAVDLVLVRDGGVIEWQDLDTNGDGVRDYSQMGQVAKNHGFIWGGDFKGLADLGHIEYHPGLTLADMKK